mgnify:CR=1 FL=1
MNNINDIAAFVPRPKIVDGRGRPFKGREIMPTLEANRDGIAKLRQRGFGLTDIHRVLTSWGVKCSYQTFYSYMKNVYSNDNRIGNRA